MHLPAQLTREGDAEQLGWLARNRGVLDGHPGALKVGPFGDGGQYLARFGPGDQFGRPFLGDVGPYGRFLPEGAERWPAIEWLMWQMGGVGPMFGQVHHFVRHNPGKSTYSEERYLKEAKRLYGVLNRRLEGRDYMVGKGRGEYSIVDMATWPWVSRYDWQQIDLHQFPHVRDWYARIAERPAVRRGYRVPKYAGDVPLP